MTPFRDRSCRFAIGGSVKVIGIAVGGSGRTRVSALDQIRQEFTVIFRNKKGLEYEELTFPPGHPAAEGYPFKNLLEAERLGREDIWLPGGVGEVRVTDWLNGISDPAARRRYQEAVKQGKLRGGEAGGIYIEKLEKLEAPMGDDKRIQITGDVSGSARLATGDNVNQGDQTQILYGPAEELQKQLKDLRRVVAQLRGAGAAADDCDVAEDAVAKIETTLQKPPASATRKEAKGALAMLKGVAEGFGSVAKIGKSFGEILDRVKPAVDEVFEHLP